jgi:ribosomal protein S12 methylthiotransferase accessory factor
VIGAAVRSEGRHALPDHLTDLMARAVHPRLGIIRSLTEADEDADTPGLFTAWTRIRDPYYGRAPAGAERQSGSGAGLDRVECLYSAIGESVERYAAAVCDPAGLTWCSGASLGERAYDVRRFVAFSERQYASDAFPYTPYDHQVERAWRPVRNLATGADVMLPAQLIHLGYRARSRAEIITQSTSTGLACGPTEAHVVATGLREVIERDAFAGAWALRRTPPRIVIGDREAPRFSAEVLRLLDNPRLAIALLDITSDLGIPTVLAVIQPRNGAIGMVVGASAHPNPVQAISKALVEAYHSLSWALQAKMAHVTQPPAISEIRDFHHHMEYYLSRENTHAASFLTQGDEVSTLLGNGSGNGRSEAADLTEVLRARGFDVLYADLSPVDVKELGLCVGRVLVPGLQPLHAGIDHYTHDIRRISSMAGHLGLEMPAGLNLDPHPFP